MNEDTAIPKPFSEIASYHAHIHYAGRPEWQHGEWLRLRIGERFEALEANAEPSLGAKAKGWLASLLLGEEAVRLALRQLPNLSFYVNNAG
ncbi:MULTISPECIES: hypothetical protein [unclassified Mesorhizobium]|uniref:hypothetical protein n=1 Tax=unclassified Mesorhizobium TaxID=325217 RepID=UPI001FE16033|nr:MULTISPECIES: hypothetical protein [unclassified Mesorhizobium]